MLDDRQMKATELYASGENISNIAKLVGVNRKTIYEWMKKDEFKAEVDRLVTEIKSNAEQKLVNDVDKYIEEIKKLALTSKSEKVRTENLQYILDRLYGKSTTKIEQTTEDKDKKEDFINLDILIEDTNNKDNIVELTKKKAK